MGLDEFRDLGSGREDSSGRVDYLSASFWLWKKGGRTVGDGNDLEFLGFQCFDNLFVPVTR